MTYKALKERQQQEINAFPFIWAFNESQLADGMRRLGLDPEKDKDKLCSIGGGGIIRKTDADAMRAMFDRHRRELQEAIAADKTGDGFIYDMFCKPRIQLHRRRYRRRKRLRADRGAAERKPRFDYRPKKGSRRPARRITDKGRGAYQLPPFFMPFSIKGYKCYTRQNARPQGVDLDKNVKVYYNIDI